MDVSVYQSFSKSGSSNASLSEASEQVSKSEVAVGHIVTDDGAGHFFNSLGVVAYAARSAVLKVAADYVESSFSSNYEKASAWETLNNTGAAGNDPAAQSSGGGSTTAKGGNYSTASFKEVAGTTLVVRYKTGTGATHHASETVTPQPVQIDLCPYTKDWIVPGSVQFTWMGTEYRDFEGVIYRNRTETNPGTASGTIDYVAGLALMTDYVVSATVQASALSIQSLWTTKPAPPTASVVFQVAVAPVKPAGLITSVVDILGNQLIATSDVQGMIVGPKQRGKIDYQSGLAEIQFGEYVMNSALSASDKAEWWYSADDVGADGKIWRPHAVDASTFRYNAVAYAYLPLNADIIGVDTVRLPQDGRVPIFRPGNYVVVGHTDKTVAQVVANGTTVDCGRVRLSRARVIGADGLAITNGYTANLEAGTVTFSNVTGYAQPVYIEHRVEDMAMVSDVDISGWLTLTRQLTHAYPPANAYVSSAMMLGDLSARASVFFDQATWAPDQWADERVGAGAAASYNDVLAPVEVSNDGAITERWAIQFTNTTTFNVIGEHVGMIAQGNTSTDIAPTNPATGKPYFTLRAIGWGAGWSAGNVQRINTIGSIVPIWVAQTIQQGPETVVNDGFSLLIRGDVDRP